MKVSFKIGRSESQERQTTIYTVEFEDQELVNFGPMPQDIIVGHAGKQSFYYNPKINPRNCDTISYKLFQLGLIAAYVETNQEPIDVTELRGIGLNRSERPKGGNERETG